MSFQHAQAHSALHNNNRPIENFGQYLQEQISYAHNKCPRNILQQQSTIHVADIESKRIVRSLALNLHHSSFVIIEIKAYNCSKS